MLPKNLSHVQPANFCRGDGSFSQYREKGAMGEQLKLRLHYFLATEA